jgi:hypothetical protein
MTVDPTTTTTTTTTTSADFGHAPVSEDSSQFNAMVTLDHQHLCRVHEELQWRQTFREDMFDRCQKKSLKVALATTSWGRPIKLGKMLYAGHLLVGLPVNLFAIHEVDSRWLITTSFLKALHLNLQTYEQIRDVPRGCSLPILSVITNHVISNGTQRGWERDHCGMDVFARKSTFSLMRSLDSLLNIHGLDSSWIFSSILPLS